MGYTPTPIEVLCFIANPASVTKVYFVVGTCCEKKTLENTGAIKPQWVWGYNVRNANTAHTLARI